MLFATRLGLVPAGLRPAVGALGCGLLGAAYPQVFAMAVLGLTVTMPTCVAVLAMARLTMAIRVLTMAVLTMALRIAAHTTRCSGEASSMRSFLT